MTKYFRNILIGLLGLSGLYFLTHLPFLTTLPVFADESIYIRWAQLILDDWRQYLFFPLNDGKTPLFVWLVVGALKLVRDPLVAGRLVSVFAGLAQVWVTVQLTKKLGGGRLGSLVAAGMVMFLPFWYFHHRLALMDGLMVLLLSLSWLWLMMAVEKKRLHVLAVVGSGIAFGLALLTKIPALLFLPTLVLTPWLVKPRTMALKHVAGVVGGVICVGIGLFLTLKLHPAFSQLFARGNDFLYSVPQLVEKGVWPVVIANARNAWLTLSTYLTLPVVLMPLAGLFQNKRRRKHALLLLSAASFIAPIVLLGKTVYPRYFLPAALPVTVSAALVFEQFFRTTQRRLKRPLALMWRAAILILGLTYVVSASLEFLLISWRNTDLLPFVPADRSQYVTEWSSGHGIRQTTTLMLEEAKTHSLAVATEGYFGTLPDGILMYLHNEDVTNLMVEGIGQPVHSIPESFRQKAQNYEKVWLVVNAHREKLGLNENHVDWRLQFYCRPTGNPCLEVWDITPLIHPAADSTAQPSNP